jgi:ubiquitin C-terminal hydrolase
MATGGPIGIRNMGNTCYFNACMQCFLHLELLRSYVISEEFTEVLNSRPQGPGAAAQEYRLLQEQIDANTKITGPVLLEAIRTLMPLDAIRKATAERQKALDKQRKAEEELREAQQGQEAAEGQAEGQTGAPTRRGPKAKPKAKAKAKANPYTPATDPHTGEDFSEALLSFLDRLHDELNIPRPVSTDLMHFDPVDQYWETVCAGDSSIIQHLFWTLTNTVTTCPKCGHATDHFEVIRLIDLALPRDGAPFSLQGLIQHFCDSGVKDGKCRKCKRKPVPLNDRIYFAKLPPVLLFLVSRFGNTPGTSRTQKRTDLVEFPDALDMTPWTPLHDTFATFPYTLHSVIQHDGRMHRSGNHYTAGVRISDDWWYFDDTRVKMVSAEHIHRLEAYCLCYVQSPDPLT